VADPDAMMVAAWRYLDGPDGWLDLIEAADGFYSKTYHLIDAALQTHPLPLPPKADIEAYLHGQFIVKLAEDWCWQEKPMPPAACWRCR
jgi:prolyl oligopeptidase